MPQSHGLSPKSPRWTTPAEVMKARQLRLARKRTAAGLAKPDSSDPPADSDTVVGSPPPPLTVRRLNPFSSLPLSAKRRLMSGVQPARSTEECPEECSAGGDGSGHGSTGANRVSPESAGLQASALLRVLDETSPTASAAASPSGSTSAISVSSPTEFMGSTRSDGDSQSLKAFSPFAAGSDIGFREWGRTLPTDWTPKVRVRLVSCKPFVCCSSMPRTIDEVNALQMAASAHAIPDAEVEANDICTDPVVKLQRALLYWCYPCLPGSDPSPWTLEKDKVISPVTLPAHMKSALRDDWGGSFVSAYGLVKSSAVPYFYLMVHSFVALFRSTTRTAPSQTDGEMTAILTPSTAGLRRALRAGGIEFAMMPTRQLPGDNHIKNGRRLRASGTSFKEQASDVHSRAPGARPVDGAGPGEGDASGTDDDQSTEDAMPDDRWLESLGVSKNSLPGLQLSTSMRQSESETSVDGRPASAIYVHGSACVHSLFNFLLNYTGCFAPTGPRAGMPPSIVAPAPFLNASLQRMKYRCLKLHDVAGALVPVGPDSAASASVAAGHGTSSATRSAASRAAASTQSSGLVERWMMEVVGPVMPDAAKLLLQLAELQGQCYVLLGVQNGTEPFNASLDTAALPTYERKRTKGDRTSPGSGPTGTSSVAGTAVCCTLRELSYSDCTWHWK